MYKFGIVGCGRIAKRYLELLRKGEVDGASLGAVCDTQPERLKIASERYGVPGFADMDKMVREAKPDVLCVLTPSGLHADHVVRLSRYGKPIIVEKPMALTLADADRMIEACEKNNSQLFVVKQNRYNLPVTKLRQALENGRFGKLVLGTIRVRWMRDESYFAQDSWRGTWAFDGGVLMNQASHHIDLLQWMMGDVESVFAYSSTALVKIETEDTAVAVVKFRSGALGVIEATNATRPKDLEGSISVLGEKGSVEIAGFAVNELRHWHFTQPTQDDATALEQFSVNPPSVYGFGHKHYLQDIVRCLDGKCPNPVNGQDGKKSLQLICGIYESIHRGAELKFPFDQTHPYLGRAKNS